MGKMDEVIGGLSGDSTQEKEYAKEVKIKAGDSAVLRFIDGKDAFVGCYISWILCDDDKIRSFTIKNDFEGVSILGRMFGNIDRYYEGGYFETRKSDIGKVATYQAKDPDLWKVMNEYWNPAYGGPGTARPSLQFIYNVIHRNPEIIDNNQATWCQMFKQTKIVRLGQKAMLSLKKCVDDDGDIMEYDVNYSKEGKGLSTINDIRKAGVNVPHVVAGLLKEEEKNYRRWDLQHITRLTEAYYCLKHIPNKIRRLDAVMGTNYYAEFEKQAAIDNAKWQEKRSTSETIEVPTHGIVNVAAVHPSTAPEVSQQPLPFDDSAIPTASQNSEPTRRVLAGSTQMVQCFSCNTPVAQGTAKCTKCGVVLMEPCSMCGNIISSRATECAFCGAKYTVS